MDDTTLDFSGTTGETNDTFLVTAGGFTAENFAVKEHARQRPRRAPIRFTDVPKLQASWDGADASKHGAFGILPVECTHVLVEDTEVSGATGAAIMISEAANVIVRRSKVHDSVVGIDLQNASDGEVYSNEVSANTTGMAVLLLGNLTKKTAGNILVHDNKVHDNNATNFGDPDSWFGGVPKGTGVLVVGTSHTEIRNNTIAANASVGLAVMSTKFLQTFIASADDPQISPHADNIFIHDNTFTDNGASPEVPFALVVDAPAQSVLLDGMTESGSPTDADAHFCLGTKSPWPSFQMFDGANDAAPVRSHTNPRKYRLITMHIATL